MHISNWMLRYESVASFCWGTKKVTQLSHSVMSNSLWLHGLQHASLPCPSPTPEVHSNSCPLSQGCNPTISSSVAPSPLAFSLSQHQGLFEWVGSPGQEPEDPSSNPSPTSTVCMLAGSRTSLYLSSLTCKMGIMSNPIPRDVVRVQSGVTPIRVIPWWSSG